MTGSSGTNSALAKRERVGAMLLVAAALLWSLNGVFVKQLHGAGLSGWTIAGYRSLFACIFVAPWAFKRWRPIDDKLYVLGAILTFSAMCATFVYAMTRTSVANAIVLQYTAPVWVFLLSPWLMRERATREQMVSLILSLAGIAVIFGSQFSLDSADSIGLAVALLSGVTFGCQTVFFRRVKAVDPMVLVFLACGGSAILLIPTAHLCGEVSISGGLLAWLVVMGLMQFAIPYVLYAMGMARMSAQLASMYMLLEPLLSPLWAWLFVSDVPHGSTFIGGGMILAGVAYVTLVRMRRARV